MTRKHYVAIARIMANHNAVLSQSDHEISRATVASIAHQMADYFASENPRNGNGGGFDRERFLKACGVTREEVTK